MEDDILIRYMNKRCSAEEGKQVREWLTEKEHRQYLFELEQVWGLKAEMRFAESKRMDQAYQKLGRQLGFGKQEIKDNKRIRKITVKEWLKYAAILIVVSLFAANLFYITKEEPVAYNTIVVPKGQRVSLLLSDGSTVWLNSESRFSYPAKFSEGYRLVKLEGEAYFEVAHNSKSPFTVDLPMLDVKVLGTKFNVKAYLDEPNWVSLKEGLVEVSTKDNKSIEKLAPNDQAYYTLSDGLVLIKGAVVKDVDAWTTGDLKFENKTLKEMAKVIERRYDVKIKIMDSSLVEEYFTCHFRKDLTITQAMELLKETRRVNYKIEKRTVYLYKN